MISIILYATLLGIALSLVLIGPVFFLLIETSITKGIRAAITLNLGVIAADLLCITVAFFGSEDIQIYITEHPSLYKIGGFIIFIYGLVMMISKPKLHFSNTSIVSTNYFRTFANGFMLNLVNIGVVLFWILVVGSIRITYPETNHFLLYIGTVISVFFIIDLGKILLSKKLKHKLTDALIYNVRKGVGAILIIFGMIIYAQSFGYFKNMDNEIETILPKK